MTLQTRDLRRAVVGTVASSAMALGLLVAVGSATASADPAAPTTPVEPTTPAEQTNPVQPTAASADILNEIGAKYMQGAGGGQISNYVKEALTLRAQGYRPSKSNIEALQAGWDYLPNQVRLIDALKSTIAYQRKLQAIQQNANNANQQPGYNFGIGQPPPGMGPTQPPGVPADPGGQNGVYLGVG